MQPFVRYIAATSDRAGIRRGPLNGIGLRGFLVLVAFVSCARMQPPPPLVLYVTNDLGRSIIEIHKKACGDLDLAFDPIEGSRLAAGEIRGLVLPSTCVDLIAYDSSGRIVGEQRGLEMLPNAKWVLRK